MTTLLDAAELGLIRDQQYTSLIVYRAVTLLAPIRRTDLAAQLPGLTTAELAGALLKLQQVQLCSVTEPYHVPSEGLPMQFELLAAPAVRRKGKRLSQVYGPGDPGYLQVQECWEYAKELGLVPKEARLLNADGTDIAVKDWGNGTVNGRYFALRSALDRYDVASIKTAFRWARGDKYWSAKFEVARFCIDTNLDPAIAASRSGAGASKVEMLRRPTTPVGEAVRR